MSWTSGGGGVEHVSAVLVWYGMEEDSRRKSEKAITWVGTLANESRPFGFMVPSIIILYAI